MVEAEPAYEIGFEDAANSTTDLLGSLESFSGDWVKNGAPQLAFSVWANVPGTLHIDFGIMTSAGTVRTVFTRDVPVYAGTGVFQAVIRMAGRYHRVRYDNGSEAQGEFGLTVSTGSGMFPYSGTEEGEILVTVSEQENNLWVTHGLSDVTADGWVLLVDRTNAGNHWHHVHTARLDLSTCYLSVDRDANAVGSLLIGVVTRIDETDMDLDVILGLPFNKSDARHIQRDRNFSPSQIKCGVEDGEFNRIITNSFLDNQAVTNTTQISRAGGGTGIVTVGSLVARYIVSSGTADLSISIHYHGQSEV